MVATGYSAVGEFHYLHHQYDGTPYGAEGSDTEPHAMELALGRAALAAGIRLVLLDTCYLQGGLAADGSVLPLDQTQQRFSDGTAAAWLERHGRLAIALKELDAGAGLLTLGAAIHSVRALAPADLETIASMLDLALPLHVHLSEQPAENHACQNAYGMTPTGLLERAGLVARAALGGARHAPERCRRSRRWVRGNASIVMCPTTEADLGDGIGPARELADAGASICLGSDQHARARPLPGAARAGTRGAAAQRTARTLLAHGNFGGCPRGRSALAGPAGHRSASIVVATDSVRTAGSDPAQLPLTATAADIAEVHVNGELVAVNGIHTRLGDPAALYAAFFDTHPEIS